MASISGKSAWAGAGILFTAEMLLVVVIFDVIQGLVARFCADVFVVGASGLVLSTDWTTGGRADRVGLGDDPRRRVPPRG